MIVNAISIKENKKNKKTTEESGQLSILKFLNIPGERKEKTQGKIKGKIKKTNEKRDDYAWRIFLSKKVRLVSCLFSFVYLLSVIHPVFAGGGDVLEGISNSVSGTFGSGSTFIKLLYMGEIFASAVVYVKTKNLLVLAGIVILSLFLNFALQHFGVGGS